MKDISTPVPPEEMRALVQRCLQKAAHINYSQLTEYSQIKGTVATVTGRALQRPFKPKPSTK